MEVVNADNGSIASNAIDLLRNDVASDDIITKMASIKLVERVTEGSKHANKTDIVMTSWSDLPLDLVETLLEKTEMPQDFVRFSFVCKTWLSIARENIFRLPYKLPISHFLPKKKPLPMLLKPCIENPDTYNLYCVNNNKTYGSFYAPEINNKWIAGSVGGWLVTVNIECTEINLSNPLTRKQISLPPLSTIPNFDEKLYGVRETMRFQIVNKVLLFSDPVEDPDNCIVVALVAAWNSIAYCRINDKKWKEIEDSPGFSDIIKHNNVLYGVTFLPDLFAIDLTGDVKVTLVARFCRFPRPCTNCYLMDSSGKLLLLLKFRRVSDDGYGPITYTFEIFELKEVLSFSDYDHDIEEDEWEHVDGIRYQWFEVKSIGDQVVFIGYNQTVWFDSHRYPGCKANCIYFADCDIDMDAHRLTNYWLPNKPYCRDVGIYHIDDDRIEQFSGFSTCPRAQTVWLSPIIQ